jgi:hypothetical protein
MGTIALVEVAAHHAERVWPELTGGFLGYWVHVTHHQLYHFILRHARGPSGSPTAH